MTSAPPPVPTVVTSTEIDPGEKSTVPAEAAVQIIELLIVP